MSRLRRAARGRRVLGLARDPTQHQRARALIARWEARSDQPDWPCPCGEPNPAAFETCWACGRERP